MVRMMVMVAPILLARPFTDAVRFEILDHITEIVSLSFPVVREAKGRSWKLNLLDAYCFDCIYRHDVPVVKDLHLLTVRLNVNFVRIERFPFFDHFD